MRLIRYLWASPNTLLGFIALGAAIATGGTARPHSGILEVHGGVLPWLLRHCAALPGGAQAVTLGHIVLARDNQSLSQTRSHERIHVHQYERWGPFFLPAYLLASFLLILARRDAYRENPFEQEAFANE